jgi:hypothetical protein
MYGTVRYGTVRYGTVRYVRVDVNQFCPVVETIFEHRHVDSL